MEKDSLGYLPRVEELASEIVRHEFCTMLNPVYRGPNWKWSKFVDHCVKWADTMVHRSFTDEEWEAWEKDARRDVRRLAKGAAERCLEESGILQWWPDPTQKPEA